MTDRKNLKKGDKVLVAPTNIRDRTVRDAVVVTRGKKFIRVQLVDSKGELYGPVNKYRNDEHMYNVDWMGYRLFLGTRDEYERELELHRISTEIYREINSKLSPDIGYDKLCAIKTIIESKSLKGAMNVLQSKTNIK